MAAAAIGTETDGSIVCPAGNNQVVGLKPTVGLVPAKGIIPIAHSQDSAGPIARTVEDVAVLMNVLARGSVDGVSRPRDYTDFLDPDGLRGARIGIERRQFLPEYFALPEINAVVEQSIAAMAAAGAVIVDPVDTGDTYAWYDAEFVVLLYEFKHDIDRFLGGSYLRNSPMRDLGDLIQFNIDHCPEEMKYFGQEIFELAEATGGDLTDPVYLEARALCLELTRTQGIDRVMAEHDLDAVLSPSYAFGSSAPACAGYPIISVPVGFASDGKPAGVWLYAGFMQEPQLIRIGYAIEQLLNPRAQQPRFLGSVPPEPPDAGICAALPSDTAPAFDAWRAAAVREVRSHRPNW
jgi:amidase